MKAEEQLESLKGYQIDQILTWQVEELARSEAARSLLLKISLAVAEVAK